MEILSGVDALKSIKSSMASKGNIIETYSGEELLVLGSYSDGGVRRYTCVQITGEEPHDCPSIRIGCCYVYYTNIHTMYEESIEEVIDTVPQKDTDIVDDAIRKYLLISDDPNAALALANADLIEEVDELKAINVTLTHDNLNLIEKVNDLEVKYRLLTEENDEFKSRIRELSGVIDPEEVEELHVADLKTEIAVLNKVIDTLLDRIGKENGKEQWQSRKALPSH